MNEDLLYFYDQAGGDEVFDSIDNFSSIADNKEDLNYFYDLLGGDQVFDDINNFRGVLTNTTPTPQAIPDTAEDSVDLESPNLEETPGLEIRGEAPDHVFDMLGYDQLLELKNKATTPLIGKPTEQDHISIDRNTLLGPNMYTITYPDGTSTAFLDEQNASFLEEARMFTNNALLGVAAKGAIDVVGIGYGAIKDIGEWALGIDGNWDNVFDNSIREFASDFEERVSTNVIQDEEYLELKERIEDDENPGFLAGVANTLEQAGHNEFWHSEISEGLESMLSFMVPGLGLGKAVQATGVTGRLAKVTGLSEKTAGNVVKLGIADLYMSGLESAVEAKDIFRNSKDYYLSQGLTEEESVDRASNIAQETFNSNMVVLMGTNMLELISLGNPFSGVTKKVVARGAGKLVVGSGSEAAQEALQFGISKHAERYKEQDYDPSEYGGVMNLKDNLAESAELAYKGVRDGNNEAITSLLLGGLMGGGAQAATIPGDVRDAFTIEKPIQNFVSNSVVQGVADIYRKDENGKILMENGSPVYDEAALLSHYGAVNESMNLQNAINNAKNNHDIDGVETLFSYQLANHAHSYFDKGVDPSKVKEAFVNAISKSDYEKSNPSIPYKDFMSIKTKAYETAEKIYRDINTEDAFAEHTPKFKQELFRNEFMHTILEGQINKLEGRKTEYENPTKLQSELNTKLDKRISDLKSFKSNLNSTSNTKSAKEDIKINNDVKAQQVVSDNIKSGNTLEQAIIDAKENNLPEGSISRAMTSAEAAKRKSNIAKINDIVFTDSSNLESAIAEFPNEEVEVKSAYNKQLSKERARAGNQTNPVKRYAEAPLLAALESELVDDSYKQEYPDSEAFLKLPYGSKLTNEKYQEKYFELVRPPADPNEGLPISNASPELFGFSTQSTPKEPPAAVKSTQPEVAEPEVTDLGLEGDPTLVDLFFGAPKTEEKENQTESKEDAPSKNDNFIATFDENLGVYRYATKEETAKKHAIRRAPEFMYKKAKAGLDKILRNTKGNDSVKVGDKITFNTIDTKYKGKNIVEAYHGKTFLGNVTFNKDINNIEAYEATVKAIEGHFRITDRSRNLGKVIGLGNPKFIMGIRRNDDVTYVGEDQLQNSDLEYTLPNYTNKEKELAAKQGFVHLMIPNPSNVYHPYRLYTPTFKMFNKEDPNYAYSDVYENKLSPKEEVLEAIEDADNELIKALVSFRRDGKNQRFKITKTPEGLYQINGAKKLYNTPLEVYNRMDIDNRPLQIDFKNINKPKFKEYLKEVLITDLDDGAPGSGSFYHSPTVFLNEPYVKKVEVKSKVPGKQTPTNYLTSDVNLANDKFFQDELGFFAQENTEAALKWFKERFPSVGYKISDEDINNFYTMSNTHGTIYGAFSQAAVILASNRPEGTTRHEAFHVAFNLFLNDKQKSKILNEVKDREGNSDKTDLQLEEILAREFAELKEQEGKPLNPIQKALKSLYNFIFNKLGYVKRMFTDPTIEEFFNQIDNNTAGRDFLGRPLTPRRNINNNPLFSSSYFSPKIEERRISFINRDKLSEYIKTESEGKAKTLSEFIDFKLEETPELSSDDIIISTYQAIANDLIKLGGSPVLDKLNTVGHALADGIQNYNPNENSFFRKLLVDLKHSHGLSLSLFNNVDRLLDEADNVIYERYQIDPLTTSPLENISNNLRFILSTIPTYSNKEIQRDDIGSIIYQDPATAFNKLLSSLNNSRSVEVMMTKLDHMANIIPWVADFRDKLNEGTTKDLFIRAGSTVNTKTITATFKKDENNKTVAVFESNRENLLTGLTESFINKHDINLPKDKAVKLKDKLNDNTELTVNELYDTFSYYGLDIDHQALEGMLQTNAGNRALKVITTNLIKVIEDPDPFGPQRKTDTNKAIKNMLTPIKLIGNHLGMYTYINAEGQLNYINQPNSWLWREFENFNPKEMKAYVNHTKAPIWDWYQEGRVKISLFDGYKNNSSRGDRYKNFTDSLLDVVNLNIWGASQNKGYSKYRFPTLADSPVTYYVDLPVFKNKDVGGQGVRDQIYEVYEQEQYFLSKVTDATDIKRFKNRKDNLSFFPIEGLTIKTPAVEARKMIDNYLNQEYKNFESDLVKKGIISIKKLESGEVYVEPSEFLGDYFNATNNESTRQKLGNYFLNSFLMNTQMLTMTSDHPSFYKDSGDIQKRHKQTHASGLYYDFEDTEYGVVYLNDEYLPSAVVTFTKEKDEDGNLIPDYENSPISKLLTKNKFKPALIKKFVDMYANSITSDGQGYHSIHRRKEIEEAANTWNTQKENVYNKIVKGEETSFEEESVFFNPIKPHVFTKVVQQVNNYVDHEGDLVVGEMLVPVQHKDSEITLLPSLAKMGSQDIQQLEKLLNDPNSEVDTVLFDSAVKVGLNNITTDLSKPYIHKIKKRDYKIQSETPEHHIDAKNLFGTQIRRHIVANLVGDYNVNGQKMTAEEVKNKFDELVSLQVKEALEKVESETSSLNQIKSKLLEGVDSRDLPDLYRDALEIKTVNGKENFLVPIWHNLVSSKFEPIFNSLFKTATKLKFPGPSLINVASYGFSELKTVYKIDETDGLKGIDYVEVLMPSWAKNLPDFNNMEEKLKKGIVYRIPTEGKYSAFPIKIVGFLPPEAGGSIIMPREATVQAGLDFDIDKVFAMMYEVNKEGKVIKSSENHTKARNNYILDIMNSILTSEQSGMEMSIPGGFQELIDFRDEHFASAKSNLNIALPQNQTTFTSRNLVGAASIGIFANSNAFHSISQNLGIKTKGFYLNKQYNELSPERDGNDDLVSRNFAIFLAASVDNAKDPVLGDLNINSETIGVLTYMLHHGTPIDEALYFINQPIISEYVNFADKSKLEGGKDPLTSFLSLNSISLADARKAEIFLSLNSVNDSSVNPKDVLTLFKQLKDASFTLGRVIQASRYDSGQVGPSIVDLDAFLQNYRSASIAKFSNIERLLPPLKNKATDSQVALGITNLQRSVGSNSKSMDAFLDIIISEVNSASRLVPYFTPNFMDIKSKIETLLPVGKKLNANSLKKINTHILNVLAANNHSYSGYENKVDFLTKFPQDFAKLDKSKLKKALRYTNLFSILEVVPDPKLPISYIKSKSTYGMDRGISNVISNEFAELYENEPELAKKLINYAFFSNGYTYKKGGFSQYIPVKYYKENPININANNISEKHKSELINAIRVNNPILFLNEISNFDVEIAHPKSGEAPLVITVKESIPVKEDNVDGLDYIHVGGVVYESVGVNDLYRRMNPKGTPFISEFTTETAFEFNRLPLEENQNIQDSNVFDDLIKCD